MTNFLSNLQYQTSRLKQSQKQLPTAQTFAKTEYVARSDSKIMAWMKEHKKLLSTVATAAVAAILSFIFPAIGGYTFIAPLTFGMVNLRSDLLGNLVKKSIKEKIHNFLDSVKSKATKLSTKTKALMASVFSLSFLTSISAVSASTGTAATISAAIPVIGWIAAGVGIGIAALSGVIKQKIIKIDRKTILEMRIKDGLNLDQLAEIVGNEGILNSDLREYFGTITLDGIRAKVLENTIKESIDTKLTISEAILKIQSNSKLMQGDVINNINDLDRYCSILYGGKTYEQLVMEIIIEDGITNEVYIEETIRLIEDKTTLISGSDPHFKRFIPMINDFCQNKYGRNYNEIIVEKRRISIINSAARLDRAWNLLAEHEAFNGYPLTRYYKRNELLGVGKFYKIVDRDGKIVRNLDGTRKYDIMGLKLGWQKYDTHYTKEKGGGYIHLTYRHWDTGLGDFKEIGIKDEKGINEFLFAVTQSQTGVNIKYGRYPNTIVYKFFSQKTGQFEYLAIGLHANDKSANTGFIVEQDTYWEIYREILKTPELNKRTFIVNPYGNII